MAQTQHAARGLSDHREGFRQQIVELGALGQPLLELVGLGAQRGIVERLHLRFQRVDLRDAAAELAQHALVAAAKNAGQEGVEHRRLRVGAGKPPDGRGGQAVHDKAACGG